MISLRRINTFDSEFSADLSSLHASIPPQVVGNLGAPLRIELGMTGSHVSDAQPKEDEDEDNVIFISDSSLVEGLVSAQTNTSTGENHINELP